MEIATIVAVHNNPEMAKDTLDSVNAFVGDKTMLIVDAKGWDEYKNFKFGNTIVQKGIFHGVNRSPYKNFCIAFIKSYETWPYADWYLWIEFDVLIISDTFKKDLENAKNHKWSAVGFNHAHHDNSNDHWLVKQILKRDVECHKLLGAVTCYSNHTVKSLYELKFYHNVLKLTSHLQGADMPNFTEYAVEEIIFPSAASVFGPVKNFEGDKHDLVKYPVRFHTEIKPEECTSLASIIHPIKDPNNFVRQHYARQRKKFKQC